MTAQIKTREHNLQQLKKSYQTNQQLKYIHLEAEIDLLLHQIQITKTKQDDNN